jgi:hypothetical protein
MKHQALMDVAHTQRQAARLRRARVSARAHLNIDRLPLSALAGDFQDSSLLFCFYGTPDIFLNILNSYTYYRQMVCPVFIYFLVRQAITVCFKIFRPREISQGIWILIIHYFMKSKNEVLRNLRITYRISF